MQQQIRSLFVLCLLVLAAPVAAQEPIVRVTMTPDVVSVGEPAEMRVTVLVPTWFTGAPTFPSFDLANAITRLPPDSSFPTSERIGNETWSGIVRRYQVYPLAAATYRFDDLALKVTFASPETRQPVSTDVAMPAVELAARVPDGAAGLDPYLSGSKLTLTLDVEGDTSALKAGDAIVLRYAAELDGLPAMFLPPLFEDPGIPGVAVYADEPVIEDADTAKRTEKITLVFEAGGEFTLPSFSLDWWDSRNEVIQTASVDALTVAVEGPPVPAAVTEPQAGDETLINRTVIGVVAVLILLALLVPRLVRRVRASMQRHRESEAYAFKRLRRVLRSGDAQTAHQELIRWLNKAHPGSNLRDFATLYGNDALRTQLDALSGSLFGGGVEQVDLRQLEWSVSRARAKLRRRSMARQRYALPPLNP